MTALPRISRPVLLAAALVMGLAAATAGKASAGQFEGLVLVPQAKTETLAPQFKRGQVVSFQTRQKRFGQFDRRHLPCLHQGL